MKSNQKLSFVNHFIFCVLALIFTLSAASSLHAGGMHPELEAALQTLGADDELRVIVKFSRRADIEALRSMPRPQRRALMVRDMKAAAEQSQRGVRSLLQERGVKDAKNIWLINGLSLKARPQLIQELSNHPDVESVRVDRAIHKNQILAQSFAAPEFNLTQINAPGLWQSPPGGYFGQGAVVGLIDTGADVNHPDLAGRMRGGTHTRVDTK
jgi:hypothetical protein